MRPDTNKGWINRYLGHSAANAKRNNVGPENRPANGMPAIRLANLDHQAANPRPARPPRLCVIGNIVVLKEGMARHSALHYCRPRLSSGAAAKAEPASQGQSLESAFEFQGRAAHEPE